MENGWDSLNKFELRRSKARTPDANISSKGNDVAASAFRCSLLDAWSFLAEGARGNY
jgi:hypothetical protein